MGKRRPEARVHSGEKDKKGEKMGRKQKPKYTEDLCGKMYLYFSGYDDRGLPSFSKFARSVRLTTEDIERFRKHPRFERAYRECQEIRRDYLIDRALDKRFDSSFAKYLISSEEEGEGKATPDNISLILTVNE